MAASSTTAPVTRRRARKKKRFQWLRDRGKRIRALFTRQAGSRAGRPTIQFARSGAEVSHLTIQGSAHHSLLVAARNINLHAPFVLVPATFIALIALVTFGIAIINAVGNPRPDKPMFTSGLRYALDVAVLPFRATSADPTCQGIARDLSREVAMKMENNLQTGAGAAGVTSAARIWLPDQILPSDLSVGGTPAQQANKLVVERGADFVLYGSVDCTAGDITVTPGFVIAPTYIQDAPELYGSYALGSFTHAISQRIDNLALAEANTEIANRAGAIATLIQGFDYYARGTEQDYDKAIVRFYQVFARGDQAPAAKGPLEAIAHVFIGNANLGAALGNCGDSLDLERLDLAQQHYQAALAIEPRMALAYLGLGNVMTQRAFYLSGDDEQVVRQYLSQADGYFETAMQAAVQPTAANVRWKALYGQALSRLIERDFTEDPARVDELLDEAESIADQLLRQYKSGALDATSADAIAAHTYLLLGEIKSQRFSNEGALDYFEKAALAAQTPRLRSLIATRLATVKNNLDDVCGAADQYHIAATHTSCDIDKLEYATLARDFKIQCEAPLLAQR